MDVSFVAIIAVLPVAFRQRNLTSVLLVYCTLYHINRMVFTHFLSVYYVVLPLLQQVNTLLWGESGQGLNNCQIKLCQSSPQTEGRDQIDLWLKLNKWHLQQKRKKGFGRRRRRRGGDQSGFGWLDASRRSKKKRSYVWLREKQTGNDGRRVEKYWTEIRCRSLFKSVHSLKESYFHRALWNNSALRVSWAKLIGDDNLLFQHGRAAKQLVAA